MKIGLAREWALAIAVTGLAIGSLVTVHLVQRKAPPKPQPAPIIVVTPSPILRDTLPAAVAPPDPVPLPRPKPKPKRKTAAKSLPTQQYSCDTIRWALRTFSRAQIDEYAKGVTGEQKAAAEACLKG